MQGIRFYGHPTNKFMNRLLSSSQINHKKRSIASDLFDKILVDALIAG